MLGRGRNQPGNVRGAERLEPDVLAGEHHRIERLHGVEFTESSSRVLGVGDLDEEPVALLLDANDDAAFAVLAARLAHLRHLEAVVDGIADERDERRAQRFQHAAVERHLATDDGEARQLAGLLAQIADGAFVDSSTAGPLSPPLD